MAGPMKVSSQNVTTCLSRDRQHLSRMSIVDSTDCGWQLCVITPEKYSLVTPLCFPELCLLKIVNWVMTNTQLYVLVCCKKQTPHVFKPIFRKLDTLTVIVITIINENISN